MRGLEGVNTQERSPGLAVLLVEPIAQLDFIELLIAPQGNQHRLLTPLLKTSHQQDHFDQLRGVPALGLHQSINGGLPRSLHLSCCGVLQGHSLSS